VTPLDSQIAKELRGALAQSRIDPFLGQSYVGRPSQADHNPPVLLSLAANLVTSFVRQIRDFLALLAKNSKIPLFSAF
jgi:hypothetical protein